MDLPTAVLRDLLDLSVSIQSDGDVVGRVTALISALRAAVPSYQGLSLTVHDKGQPVTMTSFLPAADGDITSSLRLPFTALAPAFGPQSRVIFYATAPGAFVDLADDLGHALRTPALQATSRLDLAEDLDDGLRTDGSRSGDGQQDARGEDRLIMLDADLPPHTLVSELTGLHEVSTINRAVGMLIDQGHHPDDAHATLRRHAAAAGVDTHIYAARLLRR